MAEWLAVLLDKVLETASMAGQRPYLPQEHIATSLEMILAIVRLVLHGKKDSRDKEGESKSKYITCNMELLLWFNYC